VSDSHAPRPGPISLALGIASFVLYLSRAAPTAYLLDSSELVSATWALGISHPPGHPAFHLLSFAAGLLPLGPYPWRIHLFSAVATSLAVAQLPFILRRLGALEDRRDALLAGLAGLMAAGTTAFVFQSIRGEVYALHLLVATTASLLACAPRRSLDARAIAALAVVLGVGLLNHHFLTLCLFPAILVAIATRSPSIRQAWNGGRWALLVGAAMLAGYAFEVARGLARAAASWAWPTTPGELYWVVSAAAFQKTAAKVVTVSLPEGAQKVLWLMSDQLGPLVVTASAVGLIALFRTRWRDALFLTLAIVANLSTQVAFDFDPWNPDVLGYFMASIWWLVVVFALLARDILHAPGLAPRWQAAGVAVAVGFAATTPLAWSLDARTRDLADYRDSERLRDFTLRAMPPDALWATTYFESAFNTWLAQGPEDQRPDVIHLHRSFRTYGNYDARFVSQHPELAPLLEAPARDAALSVGALESMARTRPVFIEADGIVSDAELARGVPAGGGLRWMTAPLDPQAILQRVRNHLEGIQRAVGRVGDAELQTSRNAVWLSFNLANAMRRVGNLDAARLYIGYALTHSPNDPDLRQFASSVGLEPPPTAP
jgi:hypothetical protein